MWVNKKGTQLPSFGGGVAKSSARLSLRLSLWLSYEHLGALTRGRFAGLEARGDSWRFLEPAAAAARAIETTLPLAGWGYIAEVGVVSDNRSMVCV